MPRHPPIKPEAPIDQLIEIDLRRFHAEWLAKVKQAIAADTTEGRQPRKFRNMHGYNKKRAKR